MFSAAVDFEEVRTTACAVADVVADQVGHDARVARIVLGDALLDFPDKVRTDVRSLRVDAATELCEEGHERGAETEPDDEERRLGDGDLADEGRVRGEDAPHAEERQRDDEEARHRATTHGDLDGLDEAPAGCRCGSHVRPDGNEHADDPRRHRTGSTDDEGDAGHHADRQAGQLRHIGDVGGLDQGDDDGDEERADDGEDADRRVLATNERDGALVDRAGDILHRLRAGVPGQDITGEVDGEQDRDDPGRQDDELQLARVHQDRRSSTLGWCPGSDPARDVRRSGADDEGAASRPIARLS